MIGDRASERKKRAKFFEISADFSAFLTKFQHFSAHNTALLRTVFSLNFLFQRISYIIFGNVFDPGIFESVPDRLRAIVYI